MTRIDNKPSGCYLFYVDGSGVLREEYITDGKVETIEQTKLDPSVTRVTRVTPRGTRLTIVLTETPDDESGDEGADTEGD